MTDVQIFLTVEEAAKALRIGRTRLFDLIAKGEIKSVLIGRSRRVSVEALRQYAKKLESTAA
ncbi:excisionase family DNA binding protein [Kribbella amoyensis]|uniref:Excisionase family DNA binding protein n=1 Tax=Kribbella amoyensis TaxID=996641 RepID=A0A561BJB1_9ACTN|nr:helix-turn-helix domain-containing protein [Kribbella amoyensis]TWD78958.1 excisionase family DNA binding protein [Kribbella amoyensis]